MGNALDVPQDAAASVAGAAELIRGSNVEEVQRLLLAHKKLLTYRLSGREGARIHEQWEGPT